MHAVVLIHMIEILKDAAKLFLAMLQLFSQNFIKIAAEVISLKRPDRDVVKIGHFF